MFSKEVLRFLDDTFVRRNWGHTGLLTAVGGLGVEEARWQPEGAHSVWEQLNHITHWKRYVLRRVQRRHPRSQQAWPPAGRTDGELRRTISTLRALHRDLRTAVLALTSEAFDETMGGRYRVAQLLLAATAHDSYHIGQILLTRRLYRRHRRARR